MAAGTIVTIPAFAKGDHREIAVYVTRSDNAQLSSAAFVTNLRGGQANPLAQGAASVSNAGTDGWLVTVPARTYTEVGQIICYLALTWANGDIDNSVTAEVSVQNPPS